MMELLLLPKDLIYYILSFIGYNIEDWVILFDTSPIFMELCQRLEIDDFYYLNSTIDLLLYLPNLKYLDIDPLVELDDNYIDYIINISTLDTLKLRGSNISFINKDIINLPNLTFLDLSLCGELNNLDFLEMCPKLKKLKLSRIDLSNEDISVLSNLHLLESLDLSGNNLTDESLLSLEKLPLIKLDISHTHIKNRDILLSKYCPHLQKLLF